MTVRAETATVVPKLGIALPMTSRGTDGRRLVEELTIEVQTAERHGLELCLVPEHHGGPSQSVNDPMTLVSWLLSATSSITVGSGVLLLPLHSVPRLAEQTGLLHIASGGRLAVGVGAGYQSADFDLFEVDLSRRAALLDEGMRGLSDAWRTGSHRGHPLRPSLVDVAPPDLLLGSWTKGGIRRAAALGDAWLADPIHTLDELAAHADYYRQSAAAIGRPARVVVMREGWVEDTDEAAIETYRHVVEPIFRYYHANGVFSGSPETTVDQLTLPGGLSERVVCGSPATVASQLGEVARRTEADTLVLGLRHPGGPPHEAVLEAIRLLGDEVAPRLREELL